VLESGKTLLAALLGLAIHSAVGQRTLICLGQNRTGPSGGVNCLFVASGSNGSGGTTGAAGANSNGPVPASSGGSVAGDGIGGSGGSGGAGGPGGGNGGAAAAITNTIGNLLG